MKKTKDVVIYGSGGGGKADPSSPTAGGWHNDPNTLISDASIHIVDVLGEGSIYGWDHYWGNCVYYDDVPYISEHAGNLVTNHKFTSDTSGWTIPAATYISVARRDFTTYPALDPIGVPESTGNYGIQIQRTGVECSNGITAALVYQSISNLKKDTLYRLTVNAYNPSTNESTTRGVLGESIQGQQTRTQSHDCWEELEVVFNSGSNSFVNIYCYVSDDNISSDTVYFTNFHLQAMAFNWNTQAVDWKWGRTSDSAISNVNGRETTVMAADTVIQQGIPYDFQVTDIDESIDFIRVNLRFPGGLYRILTKNGSMIECKITYRISIQHSVTLAYHTVLVKTLKGKSDTDYFRSVGIQLKESDGSWKYGDPSGGYYVRVAKVTADSDTTHKRDVSLHSVVLISKYKFLMPDVAAFAVEAKAEQFNNRVPKRTYLIKGKDDICIPSNYDPISRQYNGIWDGTFTTGWTNNPAWIIYDLITNTRYGLNRNNDIMADKWKFYECARWNDGLVLVTEDGKERYEHRFELNVSLNTQAEAFHVINALASSMWAIPYYTAGVNIDSTLGKTIPFGLVTLMQDSPCDATHIASASNIKDGLFTYSSGSLKDLSSVALVTWYNPDELYRPQVEVVEDKALIKLIGWVQKDVTAIGCTRRSEAIRYGKWILDTEKNNNEIVRFTGGFDFVDCMPGNVIEVQDPMYMSTVRYSGRVAARTANSMTIDDPAGITIEAGKTYTLHMMPEDVTQKIVNGEFSSALGSEWVAGSGVTIARDAVNNNLEMTQTSVDSDHTYCYQIINTVPGITYHCSANAFVPASMASGLEAYIYIVNGSTTTDIEDTTKTLSFDTTGSRSVATWYSVGSRFIAAGTSTIIVLWMKDGSNGNHVHYDKVSVYAASRNTSTDNLITNGEFTDTLSTEWTASNATIKRVNLNGSAYASIGLSGGIVNRADSGNDVCWALKMTATGANPYAVQTSIPVVPNVPYRVSARAYATSGSQAKITIFPLPGAATTSSTGEWQTIYLDFTPTSSTQNIFLACDTGTVYFDKVELKVNYASMITRQLTNSAGTAGTAGNPFTWATALSDTNQPFSTFPRVGGVWALSETNNATRYFRCVANTESAANEFDITGVLYDPDKWNRIENGLTIVSQQTTNIPTGAIPAPESLAAYEYAKNDGSNLTPSIHASWKHSATTTTATDGTENVPYARDPRVNYYEVEVTQKNSALTADGDFSTSTGWTGDHWTISGGVATHVAGSGNTDNLSGTTTGVYADNTYSVYVTVSNPGGGNFSGSLRVLMGTAALSETAGLEVITEDGSYVYFLKAGADDDPVIFAPTEDFDGIIDSVKVFDIQDNLVVFSGNSSTNSLDYVGVEGGYWYDIRVRAIGGGTKSTWALLENTYVAGYVTAVPAPLWVSVEKPQYTYSTTLTFVNSTKKITRSTGSFVDDGYQEGDEITITGSVSNNATYTVSTVAALELVVVESPVNESAVLCTIVGIDPCFSTKHCHIYWDDVTDEDYMPWYRLQHYELQILDTSDNLKVTHVLKGANGKPQHYNFTFEENESKAVFGTPTASFKVQVRAVDIYDQVSSWAYPASNVTASTVHAPTSLTVEGGSTTEFSGPDCNITWDITYDKTFPVSRFKHYNIRLMNSTTELYKHQQRGTTFSITKKINKDAYGGVANRSLSIKVTTEDYFGTESSAATLSVTNPAPSMAGYTPVVKDSIINSVLDWTTWFTQENIDTDTVDNTLATNAGWTVGAGWSFSSYVFEHTSGTATLECPTITGSGTKYLISFYISSHTTGSLQVALGTTVVDVPLMALLGAAPTNYTVQIIAPSNNATLKFIPTSGFDGHLIGMYTLLGADYYTPINLTVDEHDIKTFRIYSDASSPPTTLVSKVAGDSSACILPSTAHDYARIVPYDDFGAGTTSSSVSIDTAFSSRNLGDIAIYQQDTNASVLSLGTDGQVLTVDTTQTLGVKWSSAGTGDVVGPASATDHAIARYDGTTGKLLEDSGITIDNDNVLTSPGTIIVSKTYNGTTATSKVLDITVNDTAGTSGSGTLVGVNVTCQGSNPARVLTGSGGWVDLAMSGYYMDVQLRAYSNTAAYGPFISGYKSRGTEASKTTVTNGCVLLGLAGYGYYDSSSNNEAARIRMVATDTWSSTSTPSKITFSVTPSGTTTLTQTFDVTPYGVTIPAGYSICDDHNNEYLKFSHVDSAVNEVTITNAIAGSGPTISSSGSDTDINLNFTCKGSGAIVMGNAVVAPSLKFSGDTGYLYDAHGNIALSFTHGSSSCVNYLDIQNAASGSTPGIYAAGVDTDIGISIIPKGDGYVNLYRTYTGSTGSHVNMMNSIIASPSVDATTASYFGSELYMYATGTSYINSIVGNLTYGYIAHTGTIYNIVGHQVYLNQVASGTFTNAAGIVCGVYASGTSSSITSAYGLYINSFTGTIGTVYGIKVDSQTAGTTNSYGIYCEGTKNYLGGELTNTGNMVISKTYSGTTALSTVLQVTGVDATGTGTIVGLNVDVSQCPNANTRIMYGRGGWCDLGMDYTMEFQLRSFSNGTSESPFLKGFKARGTESSKTKTTNTCVLLGLSGNGYYVNGTTVTSREAARIRMVAVNDWDSSAATNAKITFSVIGGTDTIPSEAASITTTALNIPTGSQFTINGSQHTHTSSDVSGVAPTSHAANASTYGYGDTTNAGHLRAGNGLSVTTGTISTVNPVSKLSLSTGVVANSYYCHNEIMKLSSSVGALNVTDIVQTTGSNLIVASWTNGDWSANTYADAFTQSGADITRAYDTSNGGGCRSHFYSTTTGKIYRLTVNLTWASGQYPYLLTYAGNGSDYDFTTVTLVNGVNTFNFTATKTGSSALVYIWNTLACDWSATFTLYELVEGMVKTIVAGDSNLTVKHNTNFIVLDNAADFAMAAGDTLTLVSLDGVWREVGRVDF